MTPTGSLSLIFFQKSQKINFLNSSEQLLVAIGFQFYHSNSLQVNVAFLYPLISVGNKKVTHT